MQNTGAMDIDTFFSPSGMTHAQDLAIKLRMYDPSKVSSDEHCRAELKQLAIWHLVDVIRHIKGGFFPAYFHKNGSHDLSLSCPELVTLSARAVSKTADKKPRTNLVLVGNKQPNPDAELLSRINTHIQTLGYKYAIDPSQPMDFLAQVYASILEGNLSTADRPPNPKAILDLLMTTLEMEKGSQIKTDDIKKAEANRAGLIKLFKMGLISNTGPINMDHLDVPYEPLHDFAHALLMLETYYVVGKGLDRAMVDRDGQRHDTPSIFNGMIAPLVMSCDKWDRRFPHTEGMERIAAAHGVSYEYSSSRIIHVGTPQPTLPQATNVVVLQSRVARS